MKQAKLSEEVSNFKRIGSRLATLPIMDEDKENNKMFKADQ